MQQRGWVGSKCVLDVCTDLLCDSFGRHAQQFRIDEPVHNVYLLGQFATFRDACGEDQYEGNIRPNLQ